MPRRQRIHVPKGTYFVVDAFRANEMLVAAPVGGHTDADLRRFGEYRAQYEAQLSYATTRWCAHVHLHCWLPGTALLEVQIAWAPLECIMRSLRQPYTHFIHKRAGLSGDVYAGRYRAWLLEPRWIPDLRRNILWRPVRAGLCGNPLDYPHTTLNCRCNLCSRSHFQTWLKDQGIVTRSALTQFLSAPPTANFPSLLRGSPYDRRIIGSPDFVRRARRAHKRASLSAPPTLVIDWVASLLKIPPRSILYPRARSPSDLPRSLIAWLTSSTNTASTSAVAKWFADTDRLQLHRGIDRYLSNRPDLFREETLQQFVQFLGTVQSVHAANEPLVASQRRQVAS